MNSRWRGHDYTAVTTLRVSTKAQAAYQEVRRLIVEGGLLPGSTLNQEALAAELGLSITPLRETLRRLQAEGLAQPSAHGTMSISPLTVTELENLYAVRLQLEPWAAGLVAERASDEDLAHIAKLDVQTPHESAGEVLRRDRAFHRAVYTVAKNEVLIKLLDQLWMQTDRYRFILLRDHLDDQESAASEHVEIVSALQERDRRRATRLTRDHIERVLLLIRNVLLND